MPYKNPDKQREAVNKATQKRRQGIASQNTGKMQGIASAHLKEYISRDAPKMPNLERLQRIAGSLGKYATQVWFGEWDFAQIGDVVGIKPALIGKE